MVWKLASLAFDGLEELDELGDMLLTGTTLDLDCSVEESSIIPLCAHWG